MPKIHHKTHTYGRDLINVVDTHQKNLELIGYINIQCKNIYIQYKFKIIIYIHLDLEILK